jgi:hypothetical protein
MSTIQQLAARQDLEVGAGRPISITITPSGTFGDYSTPTVSMYGGLEAITIAPPTVTTGGSSWTVLWEAADTTALRAAGYGRARWAFSFVYGGSTFDVIGGAFIVQPAGWAGQVTTGVNLSVTVGSNAVSLAVTVGGTTIQGDIDGGYAAAIYGGTTAIDGGSA